MADLGAIGTYIEDEKYRVVLDISATWNITNNPVLAWGNTYPFESTARPKQEDWKTVSGDVLDSSGNPTARTLVVLERATGKFLTSTVSNGTTGAYSVKVPFAVEVQVLCLDDSGGVTENDLIHRTTPV